jgi:hypothetical protein
MIRHALGHPGLRSPKGTLKPDSPWWPMPTSMVPVWMVSFGELFPELCGTQTDSNWRIVDGFVLRQ